jgi:copper chaperone NosL
MRGPFGLYLAIGLLAASVGGCHDSNEARPLPVPVEPTEASVSHFCGMLLVEHPGPKGEVFLEGRKEPVWFSSVGETVAYTMLPEEPAAVVAIYVNDMGRAKNWAQPERGTWVEARNAWFVLGSDLNEAAGMSDTEREPIPFSEKPAAMDFVKQHGGRIVRFSEIRQEDVLGGGASTQSSANSPAGLASTSRTN